MSREKRDLRYLLLKFGVVVAISSAGLLYARFRTRKTKPYLPSPPRLSDCCSEVDDCGEDDVSDFTMAPASDHEEISATKDDDEQEIKRLRNMVRVLRERERNLEVQLLEYYGLKEQEATVLELQSQLKISNMEAKLASLKIASLQSENQRLENQVADHAKVEAELQAAKSRIKVLEKKLRHEAEQNREQILNVQKRVAKLQEQELKAPAENHDIESKLKRLKVMEGEKEELRKSNTRLQIENSELARKLESTQILPNSVETEAINKTQKRLRQENEDMKKQIEQLQEDRCTDAEELVYLRWVNACLRYELRSFRPIPGKEVARDLSKSLSPESEERAKKLILEYATAEGIEDREMDIGCDHWSCSQALYGEVDESTSGNSSVKKTPNSRKSKFFKKLRRVILGKDGATSSSKSDNMEDADSVTWSSGRGNGLVNKHESKSDRWFTSASLSSAAPTLDADLVKDIDKFRRNSDIGFYGVKIFGSGRDDASESPRRPQLGQGDLRSDVIKFAEALKQSGTERGWIHKRAASIM